MDQIGAALRSIASWFALSLSFGASVHAQHVDTIDHVTVWAQKRETALADVPLTVTSLSTEDLSNAGLNRLTDIAERLPTFDLQSTASVTTTSLRVRRVGNLGNIPTFEPAVGLFIDGAFRSRSLLGTSDMLDVSRVEVLSGPQTALYGKSASAGVVAIYTRVPSQQVDARAEITGGWIDVGGSPSLTSAKLAVSGPLTSAIRGSLATAYSHHGNTWSNAIAGERSANNDDRLTARGQLLWSANERADFRLIVGYSHEQDHEGQPDVFLAPGTASSQIADLFSQLGYARDCSDNAPHNRRSCAIGVNKLDLESLDLTLLSSFRLPNDWTLTSITGWDRYEALRSEDDAGQLRMPLLFYRDSEASSSLQEELRLSAAADSANWLVGLFLYRNDYERGMNGDRPMFGPSGPAAFDPTWPALLGGIPFALPGQLGLHDSHLDTRYASAFGNIDWLVTDRVSITTGLRWQREEKRGAINNSVTMPGASLISVALSPEVSPNGAAVNGVIERTTDNYNWSVTPHYRINRALMSYVTISRGSKSGGFNTGFGSAPLSSREFDDEDIEHYEVGARGTFTRARFSAAAFHTRYANYQDAAFLSTQFSVGNVDSLELKGVELEGTFLLGTSLTFDLAMSLVDLTYGNNTTGMCYPGRVPDGTAPGSCDLSGEHPINAPVWSTHVGAQYEYQLAGADWYVRLDWSWTDEYNTSFSADPRLVQRPYNDVGLRMGVQLSRACEIVLWGNNLLDEDVTQMDAALNLFADAGYQSFMTEARRFGATIRVRF